MANNIEKDNFFQANKKKIGWLLLLTFILGFIFGFFLLAEEKFVDSKGVQIDEKIENQLYPSNIPNNKPKY